MPGDWAVGWAGLGWAGLGWHHIASSALVAAVGAGGAGGRDGATDDQLQGIIRLTLLRVVPHSTTPAAQPAARQSGSSSGAAFE